MIDITGVTDITHLVDIAGKNPPKSITPCYEHGSWFCIRTHNTVTGVTEHVMERNITGGGIFIYPLLCLHVTF